MTHWQLGRRVRHLAAAARTVAAMAVDDPAWLTVQAGRRTPAAVRQTLGNWATRADDGRLSSVWGELLLDQPERARDRLALRATTGPLANSLGVHAGAPPGPDAADNAHARWLWLIGDLEGTRRVLQGGGVSPRLRATLAGDLEALRPGRRPVPRVRMSSTGSPTPSPTAPSPTTGTSGPAPRVLHVLTNSLPWTRSGYTLRTHAILTAQREAGVAVAGMTRPGYPVTIGKLLTGDVDVVDGIPYHRSVPSRLAPGDAARVDAWAEHLVDLARAHRATHLHSTTHYPNALAAQAAASALDLPWVHEVRGQQEHTWAARRQRAGDPDPHGSGRFQAWRARETEVARAADHVVTISETMRADLVARGVPADRISVVPNGIDAALLDRDTDPAHARARLGLPTEGFWVGCLSAVVHYEGLTALPEAVALVRSRGLDVRCAVVGDGVAWPDLAQRVKDLGLGDVFRLPGRLPRQHALRWLDALDAVLIPRENHEVTRLVPPLKLVEAMGAGKPVVVTDLPPLTELVSHGETGLVAPPGDPAALADRLQELAEDAALRKRLASNGRQVAADRTWTALTTPYLAAYAAASEHHAPRGVWT